MRTKWADDKMSRTELPKLACLIVTSVGADIVRTRTTKGMNSMQKTISLLGSTILLTALAVGACSKKESADAAADKAVATQTQASGAQVAASVKAPVADPAYPEIDIPPVYNEAGELIQPKDFREWVFIGAPLTPHGLNNGRANFPEFHNVYTQPAAFKAYRATGKWPEGTMMVKELQLVDGPAEFEDGSRYEPSGRGYFPGAVNGLDVSVKDSRRFAESQNWGYFNFNHSAPPYLASAGVRPIGECAGCHIANADEDMVYVKLYKPILDPLPLPTE